MYILSLDILTLRMNKLFSLIGSSWLFQNFARAWKDSFDFRGKMSRSEYWGFIAVQVMLAIAAVALFNLLIPIDSIKPLVRLLGLGMLLYAFGSIFPVISGQIRRVRDATQKGWLWLLTIIPYLGALIVLVIMLMPSSKVVN